MLLTVIVFAITVYVVTNLVGESLDERLRNQLLEAGRVVSDDFTRLENLHISEARRIAFTEGMPEALENEDSVAAGSIALPVVAQGRIGNLILISPRGSEVLHVILEGEGNARIIAQPSGAARSPLIAPFLARKNIDDPPMRAFGENRENGQVYYYTSMPVFVREEFYGVILIGTSLREYVGYLKTLTFADVVIYGSNGEVAASSLMTLPPEVRLTPEEFQEIIVSTERVEGRNFEQNEREYAVGFSPLQVGNDRVGVFAVILPRTYVTQFGEESRLAYGVLFTVLMVLVLAIGYIVSRAIIVPLFRLVTTSQAIAGGDLNRRTGIQTSDEIGTLATTFDEMTSRLQERTIELERMNAVLQKMDKTKNNFIQISAHELRTPLTLILGYSQILEQDVKDNPGLSNLVQGILDGADRMNDVVDSMLDVSRIDNETLPLRKSAIRLDAVIDRVGKGFAQAFEERRIQFHVEGLEQLPEISADPELMHKVFYHLIMNAIKYTPDGGRVKVQGRYLNGDEPPKIEVAVCDNGIGVDPSMKDLIFEKFHQQGDVLMHSSGKTKFKGGGPGLGLAIARGVVKAHHGQIWVESPGYSEETFPGSTFIVSLPVESEDGRNS
jgi:signal transduction histidine kinase